ncbi:MAG: phosphoribosylamine--glycine ligase [Bacteroidetes bacterium]|nr:MAG: phosphoribosylamine--glycine ligase [Bacteroidota bacterium]
MNILVIGSGGREHAISWKLKQSKLLNKLFIAPGNAGTDELGTNINIKVDDFEAMKQLVLKEKISMVVVGPEDPLVKGIYDYFTNDKELVQVKVIGPAKAAAELEGSKEFAKDFMKKYNIPTAAYQSFTKETIDQAYLFLDKLKAPYVLKADGLAAGKGVIIENNLVTAKEKLKEMLDGQFGQASKKVVIEEFLSGIELSVFVLTDGESYLILPEAKDYKRIGEGDTGPNTGGMGAISPVPFADTDFMNKVEEHIVKPTIAGFINEKFSYKGFVFIGLMNNNGNPFVIEYNVRLGDPETEVVIPRIKSDLVELFIAVAENRLADTTIDIDERTVSTVMMVSKGYPGSYEKGKEISIPGDDPETIIFHAGTKRIEDKVYTNGGRVMAISAYGAIINEALQRSYSKVAEIDFEGKNYRHDIGFDL